MNGIFEFGRMNASSGIRKATAEFGQFVSHLNHTRNFDGSRLQEKKIEDAD